MVDALVPSSSGGVVGQSLADYAQPLQIADQCRRQLQQGGFELDTPDRAKLVHRAMLPHVPAVSASHSALAEMTSSSPRFAITHGMASKMLALLFGALSKSKADAENKARLTACVDMFNPVSDIIGEATRLWTPLPKHPAVLAIAVKQLIDARVFTPMPHELRAAVMLASARLRTLRSHAGQWLDLADKADEIVFENDRAAWDAAYARLGSEVALAMLDDEDETPRGRALNELWQRKHEAERAAPSSG